MAPAVHVPCHRSWYPAEPEGRSRSPYRFEDRPAMPGSYLRQSVCTLRRLAALTLRRAGR